MNDNRYLTVAEQLEGNLQTLCYMTSYSIIVEAIGLLRQAAELERLLDEYKDAENRWCKRAGELEAALRLCEGLIAGAADPRDKKWVLEKARAALEASCST